MKLRYKLLFFFAVLLVFCFSNENVYAHPGGTDKNGGHYDNSTGEYHYHHGYTAHQHYNNECPYINNYNKSPNDDTLIIAILSIAGVVIPFTALAIFLNKKNKAKIASNLSSPVNIKSRSKDLSDLAQIHSEFYFEGILESINEDKNAFSEISCRNAKKHLASYLYEHYAKTGGTTFSEEDTFRVACIVLYNLYDIYLGLSSVFKHCGMIHVLPPNDRVFTKYENFVFKAKNISEENPRLDLEPIELKKSFIAEVALEYAKIYFKNAESEIGKIIIDAVYNRL